jgi:prepilin-type N-terminal cleavage/methylation domain-containing protein
MVSMKITRKQKKAVKGMTLIEIIIAMVVFAVAALILAQVGTTVSNISQQTNHVNRKVSIEAPYAEGHKQITYADPVEAAKNKPKEIKVTINNDIATKKKVQLNGKMVQTAVVNSSDQQITRRFDANLRYVDIDLTLKGKDKNKYSGS